MTLGCVVRRRATATSTRRATCSRTPPLCSRPASTSSSTRRSPGSITAGSTGHRRPDHAPATSRPSGSCSPAARRSRPSARLSGRVIPAGGARHQVVVTEDHPDLAAERLPMGFDLASGIYWRPEEGGIMWGMSNPAEAPGVGHEFDWDYYETDARADGGARPDHRRARAPQGLGRDHRLHARPPADPRTRCSRADGPVDGTTVAAAGGHGMMWGPGVSRCRRRPRRSTARPTSSTSTDLGLDRFDEHGRSRLAADPIALPFPEAIHPLPRARQVRGVARVVAGCRDPCRAAQILAVGTQFVGEVAGRTPSRQVWRAESPGFVRGPVVELPDLGPAAQFLAVRGAILGESGLRRRASTATAPSGAADQRVDVEGLDRVARARRPADRSPRRVHDGVHVGGRPRRARRDSIAASPASPSTRSLGRERRDGWQRDRALAASPRSSVPPVATTTSGPSSGSCTMPSATSTPAGTWLLHDHAGPEPIGQVVVRRRDRSGVGQAEAYAADVGLVLRSPARRRLEHHGVARARSAAAVAAVRGWRRTEVCDGRDAVVGEQVERLVAARARAAMPRRASVQRARVSISARGREASWDRLGEQVAQGREPGVGALEHRDAGRAQPRGLPLVDGVRDVAQHDDRLVRARRTVSMARG